MSDTIKKSFILITLLLTTLIAAVVLLNPLPQSTRIYEHSQLPMNSIQVAVITSNNALATEFVKLLKDIGVKNIVTCSDMSKIMNTVDIAILLDARDTKSVEAYLLKRKILIIPLKVYEETIIPILKKKKQQY